MKSSIVVLPLQRLPTMQLKPSSQAGASVGRNLIGDNGQIEGIISGLVAFRRSPSRPSPLEEGKWKGLGQCGLAEATTRSPRPWPVAGAR